MVIVALTVFMALANTPLCSGYDFLGKIARSEDAEPVETVEEEPVKEEEPVEEEDLAYKGVLPKYYYLVEVGKLILSKAKEGSQEEYDASALLALAYAASQDPSYPKYASEADVYNKLAETFAKYECTGERRQEPVTEEPVQEKPQDSEENGVVKPEETGVAQTLPEPQVEVKEPLDYVEMDYSEFDKSDPKKSLPFSESGNYIVIYRTETCAYCDKLIAELKGKNKAYILVIIKCSQNCADLFYNRTIYSYPSWVIIAKNKVAYYGSGYYSSASFIRMLQ